MAKPEKYPFIRAWGIQMGSFHTYIEGEVQKAIQTKAPPDAIYYRPEDPDPEMKANNGWATYRSIRRLDTKLSMYKMVKSMGVELPEPTWRDTFSTVTINVGDYAINVPGMNANNPNDVKKVAEEIDRFISEHPMEGEK